MAERPQPTPMSLAQASYITAPSELSLGDKTSTQEADRSLAGPIAYENGAYHDQVTGQTLESSHGYTTYTRTSHEESARPDTAIASGSVSTVQKRGSSAETLTAEDKNTNAAAIAPLMHKHSDAPSTSTSSSEHELEAGDFTAIKSTQEKQQRPDLSQRRSIKTEEDLFRVLSKRQTAASDPEERDEVERLMSRMFGQERQAHSEEEKTRHSGVVFRDLTVKGVGLGASLQPTVGDIFLGLPRFVKNLFTKGPKAAFGKPPVRELLSNFNGCVRPGEILLVLGRPGAGCSTFLKAFCNQRAGFEEVCGDVTYGGTSSDKMAKTYRSEIIYNPEDDLHYATLSVKRTLKFALQTRTPGKESRLEGESRSDYLKEFLRVATKLLWIEHTLGTKVGNEYVRGVSGGERKRVSIAEALITRASIQGWDNSSKGLDASTAIEYVQSLRSLTNMAQVSTAVSLYQAGEQLYDLVDKVLVIDQGQCLYFGSADHAKQYFVDLGFECPNRWTTADFLVCLMIISRPQANLDRHL